MGANIMAGLDTSIPLGIRPIDFGDPNEGRMNALRSQLLQQQMQMGQFNMMKAQRDMQYQDQQRAQAAAAAARDKAAEAQAMALYGKTGAPGYQSYSPSMEPGAASDVGMLGGGQGYTEGAVNRLAVPAQPKSFDDAIANALARGDAASVLAARKLMALKEAENVYKKSNLGVQKETADVGKADIDRSARAVEFHASTLPSVTPETWGAWRSNAVKDLPGLDQILPQTAPADPVAFEQLKRSLILKAQDSVKQHYQTITDGDQTRTVGINPITQQATPIAGTEGKSKTTEKTSDVGTLIKERAALDKNAPDYQEVLAIYNDRIAKANNIKGEGGDGERKAQSDIGKLYADLEALNKDDPEYDAKRAGIIRAVQEKTGVKAKDVGTADASIANAGQALKDIDAIMTHPELKSRAGSAGIPYLAGQIAGTKTFGLEDRVKQIQGESFLNAFNMLRGGGAITNIEGEKATAAINRMKLSLSYEDFKKAADDAKEVLQNGIKRAQELKAKGTWGGETSGTKAPAAGAPAGGNPHASKTDEQIKAELGIK